MTKNPLLAHTAERLLPRDACGEARKWILELPDRTTARQAWQQCQRGDWMLWLLGTKAVAPESDARKKLVLCACECARTALQFVPAGEDRPLRCIETAERWARGEATIEDVRAARSADAAADAAAAAAAYAAAAAAAAYTAYAAAAAAADAARTATLAECADIVRKHYRFPPRLRAKP